MFGHLAKLSFGPALALILGGCATYSAPRPAFAYFAVPCSTPGAFPAQPVDVDNGQALPPVTSGLAPSSTGASGTPSSPAPTCMIAAPIARTGYASSYYGGSSYPYYDPYYYGSRGYGYPFYGSIGIGVYGGHGFGHGGHGFGHGGGHAGGHGGHSGH